MSAGECGAQPVAIEGSLTPTCIRRVDMHQGVPHWDGGDYTWPACSQYCAQDHNHGRYRTHMGQAAGPATVAARAPKADKPWKPRRDRCSICLERAELERGKCKDREACQARAPQLDIGLEA